MPRAVPVLAKPKNGRTPPVDCGINAFPFGAKADVADARECSDDSTSVFVRGDEFSWSTGGAGSAAHSARSWNIRRGSECELIEVEPNSDSVGDRRTWGLDETKRAPAIRRVNANSTRPRSTQEGARADAALARIRDAGIENLHFAWIGSTEVGQPHYWRIQSKTFSIELDNTQDNANHVHTAWRDFTNDFGEDFLREHYAQEHKR